MPRHLESASLDFVAQGARVANQKRWGSLIEDPNRVITFHANRLVHSTLQIWIHDWMVINYCELWGFG